MPASGDLDASGVLDALAELVAAGRVLVLTGAGISTDSGIPDYRGPDGRQRHADPLTYDRFRGSEAERRRYWARSHLGWHRIARARPNASHLAVADLERAGLVQRVVTQNVDGLHTAAGNRDVIDLHGRLDAVVCLACGVRRPRLELAMRLAVVNPGFDHVGGQPEPEAARPDGDLVLDEAASSGFRTVACRPCGGVLKPDVVFFGEQVPRERFRTGLAELDQAASLLVLGSSLAVGSGYRFVAAARKRALPVAIVTRGVTRGDVQATLKVDADLATTLGALRDRLLDAPVTVP